MSHLLPDIRDVQNIQTKITFCEDNVPAAINNIATTSSDVTTEVLCANIKTELLSDTEDSISSDNNTNTKDNFRNDFPSDLFDFIIHKSDKIDFTQKNNGVLEDTNDRKRKNFEGSTETCSSNSINEESDKCSSVPRKKICARRTSVLKETQTYNTGIECSNSFQNHNLLTNDYNSQLLLEINNYINNSNQITTDPSSNLQNADSIRDNEAHRTFANKIVSLGYQLEVFSKSNLNKDIYYRNMLQKTLLECFHSLYPMILQYVLPRRNDKAYISNLLNFIAATAKHRQINMRPDFISLILKRMIIWTAHENKKAKVQYFTDYLTGDLANVLLNNTSSSNLSEKLNDNSGDTKNQDVKSCFFSTSFDEGKGITPDQIKEPLREPIVKSPIINNAENNINNNFNVTNEAVIKYNVLQRSNISVNTQKDKSPLLRQFLGSSTSLPLQNVIVPNPTYSQNMNPQLYRNSKPKNQPQSNQQHSQKVNNKVLLTQNLHQPPNYQPQIYSINKTTNTLSYYQQCQTQQLPTYQSHMNSQNVTQQKNQQPLYQNQMSNNVLIQQKNQLPQLHQNQVSNSPSHTQQVWQQQPIYDREPLPNIRNILKPQYQQHNPVQPQFCPVNQTTNTPTYYQQSQTRQPPVHQNQMSNNVQQQNQQLPLYHNQMANMLSPSKQNVNLNNFQTHMHNAQNPYQFTNHQEQIRNVSPIRNKSPAASSVEGATEYFDIFPFAALESSDRNGDPIQSSSFLVSAANNNATTTPVSTNPERSMSRDSGFISPPAENMETLLPTITYVTSLNKNVALMKNGACIICKRVTRYICLGCHKTYYCSTQCQYTDWKSHKLICNGSVIKDNN